MSASPPASFKQPQPIRFSEPRDFAELTDRLNKAMAQLHENLTALHARIDAITKNA